MNPKQNGKAVKQEREPKTVSITLSVEDQDLLDRIAKEFGLIKITDCLRLAIREADRQIEIRQQTTT